MPRHGIAFPRQSSGLIHGAARGVRNAFKSRAELQREADRRPAVWQSTRLSGKLVAHRLHCDDHAAPDALGRVRVGRRPRGRDRRRAGVRGAGARRARSLGTKAFPLSLLLFSAATAPTE